MTNRGSMCTFLATFIFTVLIAPTFLRCLGKLPTQIFANALANGVNRRWMISASAAVLSECRAQQTIAHAASTVATNPLVTPSNDKRFPTLKVVTDPQTYSALAYSPPTNFENFHAPLILVLHGAGNNDKDIVSELADPFGEHAGLIPSLIASGGAPINLLENFCVLAPYSFGKHSFYNDPRRDLIQFVEWAIENQNTEDLPIRFDPTRIVLFGFSDGATVAVELLTTRRFAAGVICSYGYTGKSLPREALERLSNIPMWIFHSEDDVIFDVANSDRLVKQLKKVNTENDVVSKDDSIVKYSRYDRDPERLPARVRGHSMGITASKSSELYEWMLSQIG